MTDSLEKEIGALRSILGSDRDPEGRAFAPLADAYLRAGNLREALRVVRDGVERLPTFATGHVVASRLYREAGMVEESEVAVRQALDLDPENVVGLDLLAGLLEDRGEHHEASRVRDQLAEIEAPASAEAPPEESDHVVDIASLAPDPPDHALDVPVPAEAAPVMEMGELVPDRSDDETVVEIGDLLADEPAAEAVMDIADLLTDEPVGEPVMEIDEPGADAREGEPVMAIGDSLADELVEEPVIDVRDLGPDDLGAHAAAWEAAEATSEGMAGAVEPGGDATTEEPEAPGEAPEAVSVDNLAADLSELAPDQPVVDIERLLGGDDAPGDVPPDLSDLVPEADLGGDEPLAEVPARDDLPVVTRTMAELFASQGRVDRAIEVYRQLSAAAPDHDGLRARLEELLADSDEPSGAGPDEDEDDVVGHAWDADAQADSHDVDTPFAWTADDPEEEAVATPPISAYLGRLLAWDPHPGDDESNDHGSGEEP